MMEEVLELLAMDSPLGDDRTESTTASSKSNDNDMDNNPSSLTGFNHSSADGTTQDDGGDIASSDISEAIETSCPNNDCDGQQQEEEEQSHPVPAAEEVRGDGPQMPISSSMPQAAPGRGMMPIQLPQWSAQLHLPVAPLPRFASQPPRDSAASRLKMRAAAATTTSHVLPNGQRVHVMNGAEFDELRRKLRMQTASRRYRKRKKDESRQQKMKLQERQSELARLQELETQLRNYQKRSRGSLEGELKFHKEEIADLWTKKIQNAAKKEIDWVNLMSSHLRN
ncbi:hypothetical protein PF010_g26106 [Phytophthora fragariae]|uniref:BZIP domain-containing protein n=1 Tax=Phytophthora fragariae TaxID=53985 RepID=A0A6G0JXS0_9STRA|nr:hypothetical protein PF010_g26106 [Phytophthora fragariae]